MFIQFFFWVRTHYTFKHFRNKMIWFLLIVNRWTFQTFHDHYVIIIDNCNLSYIIYYEAVLCRVLKTQQRLRMKMIRPVKKKAKKWTFNQTAMLKKTKRKERKQKLVLRFQHWWITYNRCISPVSKMLKVSDTSQQKNFLDMNENYFYLGNSPINF